MTQITLTQPEEIPYGLVKCHTCDQCSGATSTHCWYCGVKRKEMKR